MTNFKCSSCNNVFSLNYLPVDDHCIICGNGRIRITDEPVTVQDKEEFVPYVEEEYIKGKK